MKEGDEGYVGTESELAECVDVLHREDDEGDELTSSTAYTASMCSVLCMDSITNSQPYQDVQLENVTAGGGTWVFKSFPQFNSENEKTNCKTYQKFAELVRGCLVRVEPTLAQLTRRGCRDECNGTVCRQGCDNYERIVRSFNAAGSPPSPVQGPQLVSSTLLGDVILSISESAPPPNDQEHTPAPVGIVYRVVDQTTNYTRYFQTGFPDEASLSGRVCLSHCLPYLS
ncbi:hypothetical protein GBAR_LOCUS29559 [Geodia barretti]|uniref:Uncharacterized protein n=1 Tax=Geodia barretti TaxID=519541 RepID=A0AA35TVY7_GEOBA|nr:hypothetical protein GBAR_LOCUS29559 [Geodia barretti]